MIYPALVRRRAKYIVFLEYDYSYRIHFLMACYAFSAVLAHYLLVPLSYGKVFVYVSQVLR